MADENNGAPNTHGEDSDPKGNGQPPANEGVPSDNKPPIDPSEQSRRDMQSKKDKSQHQNDDMAERLSSLEMRESERVRDQYVNELISGNKDKYPNVDPNNPMFKYATSKDEVEDIAKQLQNQFTDMQQKALESVQSEPEYLTDEQIAQKNTELEKEVKETGKSRFSQYMSNLSRRKA